MPMNKNALIIMRKKPIQKNWELYTQIDSLSINLHSI